MAITTHPASSEHRKAASSTPNSRRNWGIVVLLLIFFMLNFADKAAIGLASEPIREGMGLSASDYGLLSSAFFWLFAVGAVVLTAAFRRISYNWAAGILMVTWILSMLPLTTQTSFGVLLVSRIALGFFEGPAHALCQSIVHGLFPPEKRATAGAVVNAGSSLGPLLAAPALTWIILTWDWHASFIFLTAISVVWVIIWFAYADKLPFRKRSVDHAIRPAAVDPNQDIVVPFYRLLLTPSFWGLALLSFAGYLITSLKVTWLPAFMNEGLGYSMESVGLLVTIPYVV
ncbi:MFS transporter, partial [Citricoccus sp.]|uniref:MFS transporter n=1 Tax=Citricoccus sp. TaxID=1978372 RepID=UPI0028BF0D9D